MGQRLGFGVIVAAGLAAGGCLQNDTTHTVYLSPGGQASWMAIERNVRSDSSDPAARFGEEQDYIYAAADSAHGVGRALFTIEPVRLHTRILRSERPFVVVTEAEFGPVDALVRRLLTQSRVDGDATLSQDGPVTTLTVRVDLRNAPESGNDDSDEPLDGLIEELDRYRIVLTEGRFTGARGFQMTADGTQAVPIETPSAHIEANGGVLEMSLSWTR
jgi:hypothetical protein